MRNCWIVMQYQKAECEENSSYHFQGVFDSLDKAVAECHTNQYYVIPATMNESLPQESFENDEQFFPIK